MGRAICEQAAPASYVFEAAPIVVDGLMFVSGRDGHVWALGARNGTMLWRHRHAIPLDTPLCRQCQSGRRLQAVHAPPDAAVG